MSIIPWRTRRQLLYFSVFALAVLVLVAGLVWYLWPEPTCFDGRKNGGEDGIDCGGQCTPCLGKIKDISQIWVRFFKNKEGFYDAAALVDNSNLTAALSVLKYRFKLYDANNLTIAVREGQTFINPGEQQIIFESNIATGPRFPRYVYIEFDSAKDWQYLKKEKSFLSVAQKAFINFPFPRFSAEIRNDSMFDVKNVLATGVLYDETDNAIGVAFTKIDFIKAESSQWANFTWPQPFDKEPASTEVFVTTDLTKNNK